MSLGQGGPSFDDVPASAAPNKSVTASYSYRDQSRSPVFSDRDDLPGRPSLDSPYRYAQDRSEENLDMRRPQTRNRNGELPRLQANGTLDEFEEEGYNPVGDDDPTSYDLVGPVQAESGQKKQWNLEKQSQALFSKEHLQIIFGDPGFLLKFTSFLGLHRPQSVPILVHYLDSLKALRALHYANAILEGLDEVPGLDFTSGGVDPTANVSLLKRATDAFDYLVREELPAFVTHEYIQVVSASITARISGMLAPHLREASEGLAEVFCLTDPSRPDNPIVFASEEFNRTTQYGMSYVLGRNCRFLQGPYTNPLSVRRLRDATKAGRQHQEVFLNYRRDGSPFMNLLMVAPLCDSRGMVRYFIGAQVDVSGLVKDCAEMASLERLLDKQSRDETVPDHQAPNPEKNDELRELSEMLNMNELSTIRKYGGRMHMDGDSEDNDSDVQEGSVASGHPRLLIKDPNTLTPPWEMGEPNMDEMPNGNSPAAGSATSTSSQHKIYGHLGGIYNHYLLIRPYPSLRILFASPSQRVPGILQSPFMNKIGGSNRVREELTAAFADGRGVTAKVRWVSKHDDEGRNKWIHCTPLVGVNGNIGVWMVVIVDDERHKIQRERERIGARMAPPVPADTRERATPDRDRVRDASRSNHRPTSQSAAAALRYGYSSGGGARGNGLADRTVPSDRNNSLDDRDGSGSIESYRI
ncbi:hypothetical protein OHC33_008090 [Knufia fluminis]|uniref:PAC domain-containing protein n=1 Tax=Knufia fluminis TaxID=191047 RepID=A0AAN8EBH7_9EURO|nr:hypothetical protein OHC33_008090 [Knufia fluminis]